jgi:hypothetical protein
MYRRIKMDKKVLEKVECFCVLGENSEDLVCFSQRDDLIASWDSKSLFTSCWNLRHRSRSILSRFLILQFRSDCYLFFLLSVWIASCLIRQRSSTLNNLSGDFQPSNHGIKTVKAINLITERINTYWTEFRSVFKVCEATFVSNCGKASSQSTWSSSISCFFYFLFL